MGGNQKEKLPFAQGTHDSVCIRMFIQCVDAGICVPIVDAALLTVIACPNIIS